MYSILDRVVLEDKKEYIIASTATIAEETFYLLVDINDETNIKYMREEDNGKTLAEVHDMKLLPDLAIVLYENQKKYFK